MNEELQKIVQSMVEAGESEENIALVIREYDSTNPTEEVGKMGGAQSVAAPVAPSQDGVSKEQSTEPSMQQPKELPQEQNQLQANLGVPIPESITNTVKKQVEKPYGDYFENKSMYSKDAFEPIDKELEDLNLALTKNEEERLELKKSWSSGDDFKENFDKRVEILQNKKALENKKKSLINNNIDIDANNKGYVYSIDGKNYTKSQFYKAIASNEMEDRMRSDDNKPKINVIGDAGMQELVDVNKKASEIGFVESTTKGTVSTALSVFDTPFKVRAAEVLSVFLDEDNLAGAMTAMFPAEAANTQLAIAKAKEEGGDVSDAFLREYAKSLSEKTENIRGIQYHKEEDAIDRLVSGDVSGFLKDATKMSIESSPYLAAAMIPYAGTAIVYNSVQANKYYEYRNEGVEKGKAMLASNMNATIETADMLVSKFLLKNALKTAKNTIKSGNKFGGFSYQDALKVAQDVAKPFITEVPTEIMQGTSSAIVDQWAKGEDIDMVEATRAGLLEGSAALPTSALFASPVLTSSVYSNTKQYLKFKKLTNAIYKDLETSIGLDNQADGKVIRSNIKNMVNDYVNVIEDARKIREKATEEESKTLKDLSVREIGLERTINDTKVSKETREIAEEELSNTKEAKDNLLLEIEKRIKEEDEIGLVKVKEEEVSEQPIAETKDGAQPTQEKQANVETVVAEEQEVTSQESQEEATVEESKEAKKPVNLTQETKGLTVTERFKQGFEEFVGSLKEKEAGKRAELKEKSKANLKAAREVMTARFKEKSKNLSEARKELKNTINELAASSGLSSISKAALKKINTRTSKVTDGTIGRITSEVEAVFQNEVRGKKRQELPKLLERAKKVIAKGRVTMNQSSFNNFFGVNGRFIPFNDKGDALIDEIESLANDILRDENLNPTEAIDRAEKITKEYAKIEDFNQEASDIYKKNKKDGETKPQTIARLFEEEVINESQARALRLMDLKEAKEKTDSLSDEQIEKRDAKIDEIIANIKNINPKRRAELITKVGRGFKAPIEALWDALQTFDSDSTRPLLERMSPQGLEQIRRALVVGIPNNDLTALNKGLAELDALKREDAASKLLSNVETRQSVNDLWGWFKKFIGKDASIGKLNRLRRMPLDKIDYFFGIKGRKLFKSFLEPLAVAQSNIEGQINELISIVADPVKAINKKGDKEASLADKRMFFHQLGVLFKSNKGRKGIFDPQEVYDAIMDKIPVSGGTPYITRLRNGMKEFNDKYVKDGVLDLEKINNELSKEELDYLVKRKKVVGHIEELARVATSVIRGEVFDEVNGYMTQSNNMSGKDAIKAELKKAEDIVAGDGVFNARPSTKAGTAKQLQARTAQAIVPSIFQADKKMVDSIVLDYNMTLPMKSVNKLINNLKKRYKESGDDKALANVELIERVIVEALSNDLVVKADNRGELNRPAWMNAVNYLVKKGYEYGLGTPVRAVAELLSNAWYIGVADPAAVRAGMKFINFNNEVKLVKMARLLDIVRATQTQRLLGNEITSILAEANAFKGSQPTTKLGEVISKVQENLLGKPDMIAAQAAWFGKFSLAYKKATGRNLNLDTFSENDYQMNKNAFDKAALEADEFLANAVASNNSYTGILASTRTPTDNPVQIFDKFLTRFARFERAVLAQNASALIKGEEKSGIGRRKALANMGASMGRFYMYNMVLNQSINLLAAALFGGDSDEEDDKLKDHDLFSSILDFVNESGEESEEAGYRVVRELMSYVFTMGFGNLGNWSKAGYNLAIEYINMNYGEGITRPESSDNEKNEKGWKQSNSYEPFEYGVVYSPIKVNEATKGKEMRLKDVFFVAGAGSSVLKHTYETAINITKIWDFNEKLESGELSAKETVTYEEYKKAREDKLLYRNLPALLGAFSGLPTKDFERIGNRYLYKDIGEEDKKRKKEYAKDIKTLIQSSKQTMKKLPTKKLD